MLPDHLMRRIACALSLLLGLVGCPRPREVPIQTQRQAAAKPAQDAQPTSTVEASPAAAEDASAPSSKGQSAASESAPSAADSSDSNEDSKGSGAAGSDNAAPRSSAASSGAASTPARSSAQRATADAPKLTPVAAAREARAGLDAARKAEKSGNASGALEQALRGYQAARAHPRDPACQQIASELLPLLERVGEKVNSAAGGAGSDANFKPFRVD